MSGRMQETRTIKLSDPGIIWDNMGLCQNTYDCVKGTK